MAAPQEVAISPDTEATGHLLTITVPQEETVHSATIQAAVPIVLHIQIQEAQVPTQIQAAQEAQAPTQTQVAQVQAHQVAVAAVVVAHAAVAA